MTVSVVAVNVNEMGDRLMSGEDPREADVCTEPGQ